MKNEKPPDEFRIKSYGKGQLAGLYFTGRSPEAAIKAFKKAIAQSPDLLKKLTETGMALRNRVYTPAQVKLIVDALGEP